MTQPSDDIAQEEFAAYAAVVASVDGEDQFVAAFVAFVEYLAERSQSPYEIVAGFVCGLIEGRAIVDPPPLEAFVAAFVSYANDVIGRESEPHEKIARFAHSMVEGSRESIAELMGGAT